MQRALNGVERYVPLEQMIYSCLASGRSVGGAVEMLVGLCDCCWLQPVGMNVQRTAVQLQSLQYSLRWHAL
jgi:hypothetical protein